MKMPTSHVLAFRDMLNAAVLADDDGGRRLAFRMAFASFEQSTAPAAAVTGCRMISEAKL
jgi:hypothetical protein